MSEERGEVMMTRTREDQEITEEEQAAYERLRSYEESLPEHLRAPLPKRTDKRDA